MICRIDEMKNKQVVCVRDGCVLGYISDIELDTEKGTLTSIIIYGKLRFFGLFGRENDIIIPYDDIKVIGAETVLVSTSVNLSLNDSRGKKRFTNL
ncbi:MAG: YlmC/YmxH family sporulation protein [Clostridia bacterium]|nr:YlmC/YmxH family sporulation protein [Clostridia bacterium]